MGQDFEHLLGFGHLHSPLPLFYTSSILNLVVESTGMDFKTSTLVFHEDSYVSKPTFLYFILIQTTDRSQNQHFFILF